MEGRERFELVRPLGKGGSGQVHLARDRTTGAEVALKLVELDPHDVEGQVRFRREAEALARLAHPRIVRLVAWGLDGGPWLALEHLESGSLEELVARRGPLPERQAARIAADLARALEHAHRAGVLHRDVKPANLVLDREQQVRLIDFGLARPLAVGSELTVKGALLGTPGYMAPELARGFAGEAGPPADVYGLGASLYYLLSGHAPFEGKSALSVMQAVVTDPPLRPGVHRPGLAPELEQLVLRCLAKEPGARPELAGLVDALERHARRRAARERSLAVPAAIALLACGAALAAWVVARRAWVPEADRGEIAAPPSSAASTAPPPEVDAMRKARAVSHVQRGADLLDAQDPQAALPEFERAVEADPRNVDALANRGLCRQMAGDRAGALADYDRALELEPLHLIARFNRANLRLGLGDLEGALKDAELARERIGPGHYLFAPLEEQLGTIRAGLGR